MRARLEGAFECIRASASRDGVSDRRSRRSVPGRDSEGSVESKTQSQPKRTHQNAPNREEGMINLRNQILGCNPRSSYTSTQNACTCDKDSPPSTDDRKTDAKTDTDHCPCVRRGFFQELSYVECFTVACLCERAQSKRAGKVLAQQHIRTNMRGQGG